MHRKGSMLHMHPLVRAIEIGSPILRMLMDAARVKNMRFLGSGTSLLLPQNTIALETRYAIGFHEAHFCLQGGSCQDPPAAQTLSIETGVSFLFAGQKDDGAVISLSSEAVSGVWRILYSRQAAGEEGLAATVARLLKIEAGEESVPAGDVLMAMNIARMIATDIIEEHRKALNQKWRALPS